MFIQLTELHVAHLCLLCILYYILRRFRHTKPNLKGGIPDDIIYLTSYEIAKTTLFFNTVGNGNTVADTSASLWGTGILIYFRH